MTWLWIVLGVLGGFIAGVCAFPVWLMFREMRGKGIEW